MKPDKLKKKKCSLCLKKKSMNKGDDICQECSDEINYYPDTGTSEDYK